MRTFEFAHILQDPGIGHLAGGELISDLDLASFLAFVRQLSQSERSHNVFQFTCANHEMATLRISAIFSRICV
jgi:hypothetical protein